jgi:hypothetical protein
VWASRTGSALAHTLVVLAARRRGAGRRRSGSA